MGSGTKSISSSLSTGSTVTSAVSRSSQSRERLSITSTLLNGQNYVVWAKAVEIYYVGESEYHYLNLLMTFPRRLPHLMLFGFLRMLRFGLSFGTIWRRILRILWVSYLLQRKYG
ncbi:hypothetical protein RHMOL_Rhmol02G0206500 [Rhododendron molle]|uniref:Uncharacterized protein n=1 Tax=Rhododendron molle TaxID=49168 RepID=A0ACC0PSQ8_RHOML|nr:hypothetical protein RHMOL_Rhmol02G0206500 [Rhododendron molle]